MRSRINFSPVGPGGASDSVEGIDSVPPAASTSAPLVPPSELAVSGAEALARAFVALYQDKSSSGKHKLEKLDYVVIDGRPAKVIGFRGEQYVFFYSTAATSRM